MRVRLPFFTLAVAVSLVTLPTLAQRQAETFSGRVVAVTDGDTLGVLRDGKEVKLRLHALDAPEFGQPWGSVAKSELSGKVFGKTVTVRITDTDKYGRLVGVVTLDRTNVNESLVREGLAWWYHQYGPKERELAEAEIEARAARRGLWKDANPVPPWAFRNALPELQRPKAAEPSPPGGTLKPAAAPAAQGVTVYATNTGSKYHRDGCRHLKSRVPLSLDAAKAKGLTPCGVCRP